MKTTVRNLSVLYAISSAAACATTQPPAQLVEAREAYSQAQRSDAAKYDPAALHEAQQALQRAETMFADDGDQPEVTDAAYVATRRAQQAKAEGEVAHLQQRKADAERNAEQSRAKAAEQTQKELSSTRAQLEQERAAREAAETKADQAMAKLRDTESASMQEQSRGTVITVAGAFLFGSGKAQLQPGAHAKLDKIADALKEQGERKILVEGYTDSRGSDTLNMQLSEQRAQAVADYLASRGVARDKLTAVGRGPSDPIAPNDTPQGRAQNRRVEITVQRPESR
ncbi:MAG TPA: OmpA family protein [Polyangiales bacterium]|nr:OmpA family protein [Polyangiales bacterium]